MRNRWSIAYELFTYCSSLIYFSVATVTTTTKTQKHLSLLLLPPLILNTLLQILSYPGVVELTTQLLILKNILWLPLCRINKFGLNTLHSKTVAIPYTCGLSSDTELAPIYQYNVGMYSKYSHTCLWKRTCMASFVLSSRGSGVLAETKRY